MNGIAFAVLAVGFSVMHHRATAKLDGWVYFFGFWAFALAAVLAVSAA